MEAEKGGKRILEALFSDSADIGMVLGVVGILMAMILPIPPFMLDLFLAFSVTVAIIILITTIYTVKPLDFSIFPSVLLILTLFRLSLNVASTRLILLHGDEGTTAAGTIIMAFGNFVVGGNYVVGIIIFTILVLINFMVITKGSGRIAEVAARFTLDGMPGKQMAIDADLNAGIIDEIEAKERRQNIARESEFHGAMDGASKFVRGDAVAGIIITGVNILAGLIIGVFQKNMALADAATNYTILTVGDGLVSQIPALIISTSAGILVSRSGSEGKMGEEFREHIFSKPMPIYIGSAVVLFIGIIPGMPTVPFFILSALLAGGTYWAKLREASVEEEERATLPGEPSEDEAEEAGPEDVDHLLSLDVMELEVGYGLIPLVDKSQDGSLLGRIRSIRRQFASEMGIIIPPIHIRDNLKLKPAEYRLLIKGVEMARGELMVNHLLAMDPGDVTGQLEGIPTTEPAFNLPAIWIPPEKEEDAKFAGYTVVDNSTVVATHITEVIRSNASDLLGRQEIQHLLDNLAKSSPRAVEELVPNLMSLGMVQKVIQNLLREKIPVKDLLTIIETLADYAPMSKDTDLLTEYVRQKLGRSIIGPYVQPDSSLPVITIDQPVEDILNNAIKHTEHGSYMSVDPQIAEAVITAAKDEVERNANMNIQPIILCSPGLRRHLYGMLAPFLPSIFVTSHAEIVQNISIKSTGMITFNNAA